MAQKWEEVEFTLRQEEVDFLLKQESHKRKEILEKAIHVFTENKKYYGEVLKIKSSKERNLRIMNDTKIHDLEYSYMEEYIKGYKKNNNNVNWLDENVFNNYDNEILQGIICQYNLSYTHDSFMSDLDYPEMLSFYFIEDWVKNNKPISENFYDISYGENMLTDDIIKKEIKKLDYKTFLNTAYWKLVAKKTKEHYQDKCVVCDNTDNLNAHHKTYKRHGEEHLFYKQDLVCLCNKCHEKYHDIKRSL